MAHLRLNDGEPHEITGHGGSSEEFWRVRWRDGHIDNFSTEEQAREFRARFPVDALVVIESQSVELCWEVGVWEKAASIAQLYSKPGSKVHIVSPDSTRFMCGIRRTASWRRIQGAPLTEVCDRCTKREFTLAHS